MVNWSVGLLNLGGDNSYCGISLCTGPCWLGACNVLIGCTARVCCYIVNPVPTVGLSDVTSRDTQKWHHCSWTYLLSKWCCIDTNNSALDSNQATQGGYEHTQKYWCRMWGPTWVHSYKHRYKYRYKIQGTPWNKCKAPYKYIVYSRWPIFMGY